MGFPGGGLMSPALAKASADENCESFRDRVRLR